MFKRILPSMILRLVLTLLITFFVSCFAFGQMSISGISLAADASEFDNENNTLTLTGNVQIIYNGYYLSSNKAILHRLTKQVVAIGDVVLQTTTIYLEADKADFNLDTQLGVFYKAFLQSGKVIFEGDVISKVGEKNYEAVNGSYTACNTCPAAWSFNGKKISAELGGYADISLPLLKVANFPVFILPRILVPLKTDRQSGVLVPSVNFGGANGFTLANRYFWAISKSQDLTISAIRYETRGWKGHGHYRYVLDENSRGQLIGAYLNDQAFKNCVQDCSGASQEDVTEQQINRGILHYSHYYQLPHNLVQRAELTWISDLRYLRDFADEVMGIHGSSAITNTFSLTKNTETQHLYGEAAFYTNLLKEKYFANNDDSVHRLPEINYSLMEQRVADTKLLFRFDLRYTNFSRANFSYDEICSEDPSLNMPCLDGESLDTRRPPRTRSDDIRDGIFHPDRDLIRTGQRLVLTPQISYPILIGNALNILPSLRYTESQYRFNILSDEVADTAARRHLEADVSIKTLFSRLYGDTENQDESSFKHEIEPEIIYSQVPWIRRPEHSFFGDFESQPFARSEENLTDLDLFGRDTNLYGKNRVQFDYNDRLFNRKLATFKLVNNIVRKNWRDGSPYYRSIAYFSILQSYDFDAVHTATPYPWSNIHGQLRVNFDNFVIFSRAMYYPYANATNNSTRVRYITPYNSFFETTFTQTFAVNERNEYKYNARNETISGGAGFNLQYLLLRGTVNFNSVSKELQAWRYEAFIKPPGECWNLQFTQWFPIGAEKPEYTINFNFDFSGKGKQQIEPITTTI